MSKQPKMLPVLDRCCTPLVRQALGEQAATELARMFKALGDPVRLRLLSMIASQVGDNGPGEVCVLEPGHDAWVIGDEPVVVVDWGGAHVWGKPHEH